MHWQSCVVSSGPHLAFRSACSVGLTVSCPCPGFEEQSLLPFSQPSIRVLDLSGNQFSGTLPNSLLNMTSLSYLELGANRLSGCPALPPSTCRPAPAALALALPA